MSKCYGRATEHGCATKGNLYDESSNQGRNQGSGWLSSMPSSLSQPHPRNPRYSEDTFLDLGLEVFVE